MYVCMYVEKGQATLWEARPCPVAATCGVIAYLLLRLRFGSLAAHHTPTILPEPEACPLFGLTDSRPRSPPLFFRENHPG